MMIASGEADKPEGKTAPSAGDRHISRIAGNRGAFFVTQTTNFHIGAEILMLAWHHQSLLDSSGRALTPDSPAVSGLRSATPPRLWRSVGLPLHGWGFYTKLRVDHRSPHVSSLAIVACIGLLDPV